MEPDVRYCTTADGVRIAYTVTGEGPVNVSIIDPIVSHVALEWSHPVSKRILEETARYFTLVRFDSRGTGLSERVLPTSLDDTLLDIEAVVERLRLDQFTLQANTTSTPTAIAFATRHPDRVSRMVIIDGYARSRDLYAEPAVAAIMAAASSDWETATEAIGAMVFGPGRKESRMHGEYIRACIGPEYLTSAGSFASVDVSAMTSMLLMPVLVVRHAGVRWITDQMTQDLVAGIPDARLVIVNGTWPDDPEGLARRIAAFVYESTDPPAARGKHTPSGVRTVLFTDIVGHTEMMQRLGDAKGRDVLREHERITRETLKHHGGTELKTMGDGFMASFGSVTQAMDCAIALQRAFSAHTAGLQERRDAALAPSPLAEPLNVRVGLNAGEPIEEDGDLFGSTVILASRIAAKAGPGEILVPDTVRGLLSGKGFVFGDRGEFVPKGFDEGVRLWEVRWQE